MSFPARNVRAAHRDVRPRRPTRLATFERLESRLALSTTPAGPTIGQTLAALVDNTALGGIQISGQTSSFAASPNYLLLTQAGQGNAPYALVSYGAKTTAPQAFTTLSLAAGDGNQAFSQSTVVAQAASGNSANASTFGSLSKAVTNSLSVTAGDFTGTGFIYILGGGGNGVFSYNRTTSTLPTSTAAGTFRGLLAVGAPGMSGSKNKFGEISVGKGSVVVDSSAPTPGSSIVPRAITITQPTKAKPTFVLPVIGGQYGFAKPTAGRPGSVIVGTGASSFIVNYTGIRPNGLALTGCTTMHTGSIPFNTAVNATANAPVSFTFHNNSRQGVGVYAAIAGQQSDVNGNLTYGYLVPRQKGGVNDFTKPLQFVSMVSSNAPTVPTFQLFAAAAKPSAKMSFQVDNKPNARMVSTRVVFGMGQPPVIPIVGKQPFFPAMNNPSDPNNRINFDFVEFTMRHSSPNDGTLFINTTQVDQVGLPFRMNINPRDSSGAVSGVGIKQSRAGLAAGYTSFVTTQFTGSGDSSISLTAEAAFKGLLTPYRLLNPSDAITNPPERYTSKPTLDGYFDAALATFFSNYHTGGSFRLQRDGYFFVGTTETGYQPAAAQYSATLTAGSTASVTSATANGTQITYQATNTFQPGQTVSIVNLQPAGFNLANQTIVSATSSSFTIENGQAAATSTAGGSATGLPMLSFPAAVNLAAGLLVTGPGITGTAVVTTQPVVDGSNVTHVSLAGDIANGSGSYSFTSPGEFTVLKLQQADANWSVISGGQTYRVYAPYFAPMGGTGGATAFPAGLPVGTGIGSLSLTSVGVGYALNTVGQLTFSGGGGGNGAAGFYVTDGTGEVTAIGLTNPGSGYHSMPTVGFSGTSSTAAVVAVSALPAAPSWVAPGGPATVQSPGLMTFGCLGVFADGGQQALAGQVSGGISQLSLTSGGVGYALSTSGTLTFTGGGGNGAAGTYSTNAQGVITAIGLTHPGGGYSMPTIGFSGPSNTAAVVTASLTATGGTLSDIQNTIVSAFNRGVANAVAADTDVTSLWNTASNFYPKPAATGANWSNLYSAYLHNPSVSVPRPNSQVGLAYGFAYDDQGDNSTTLATAFPQGVSIELKPWSVQRFAATPLAFTASGLPAVAGGVLSATLKGLPNTQYNWQLWQVPSLASGQWTQVLKGTAPVTTTGTVSVNRMPVSVPGTYVLVVWAANVPSNDFKSTTAAALQFGGQYTASGRFTVTASQLRSARLPAAREAVFPL